MSNVETLDFYIVVVYMVHFVKARDACDFLTLSLVKLNRQGNYFRNIYFARCYGFCHLPYCPYVWFPKMVRNITLACVLLSTNWIMILISITSTNDNARFEKFKWTIITKVLTFHAQHFEHCRPWWPSVPTLKHRWT